MKRRAPSVASNVVSVKLTGQTVNLTDFEDATGLSHQNVTKIRIYRSVSGSTPTFLFVDEIPASNAATPGYTYNDSKTATQLGEEELQTIIRVPPDRTIRPFCMQFQLF